jgi:hypothetical protein
MSENTIKVAKNEINNNEATKSPDEKPKEVFVVKSVKVARAEGEENDGELANVEPAALEVPGWGDADGVGRLVPYALENIGLVHPTNTD